MSRWFCAFEVNFWAQREPKRENNACNLVAAGAPYNKQGTKDVKNQEAGCWPQLAEMHMKGMISVRPDSCIFLYIVAAATKSLQSCPTLCDPMDYSPPGSSIHGILQARIRGLPCPPPGIFLTQGSNLCLLYCRHILYHWATEEDPRRVPHLPESSAFSAPYILLVFYNADEPLQGHSKKNGHKETGKVREYNFWLSKGRVRLPSPLSVPSSFSSLNPVCPSKINHSHSSKHSWPCPSTSQVGPEPRRFPHTFTFWSLSETFRASLIIIYMQQNSLNLDFD